MFYSSTDGQYIQENTPFTIDGVQYPANWLNLSTPEEKTALGLEEVVATNSPANDQYYWVSTELNGASLTYVNTPKDLTDVKDNAFNQVNSTAYSILLPSDWMVVKAFETSTKINTDWNTYRANVRACADNARTMITGAPDVDTVAGVMGAIAMASITCTISGRSTSRVMFQTAFQPTAFQNNAFQINITPPTPSGPTGGDGWTKEEWKHYQELDKKKRKAEEKRIAALKADKQKRKDAISGLVDPKPVAKTQQKSKNNIQSNQVVSVDTPSQLANIDRYIANLEKQQQDLRTAVAMREAKLRLEQEIAILEAKRLAELDDEEALLALIL